MRSTWKVQLTLLLSLCVFWVSVPTVSAATAQEAIDAHHCLMVEPGISQDDALVLARQYAATKELDISVGYVRTVQWSPLCGGDGFWHFEFKPEKGGKTVCINVSERRNVNMWFREQA